MHGGPYVRISLSARLRVWCCVEHGDSGEDFAQDVFKIELLLAHVLNLLRARGLAFDGDGPCIAEAMKLGEDGLEVHQPFADQHFFAELAWVGGPAAVFGMNAADMRAEDVDRVDRIGFAVKDQVGGIETDSEVRQVDIANHARHGRRRLLTGLHEEVLAVAATMLRDGANGLDRAWIFRVGWIFWNETAMCLHLADAEQLGEIGNLAKCIDASSACGGRNKADGGRAAKEVPLERRWANDFDGGGNDVVFRKQVLELVGELRRESTADISVERKKAVGEAEIVDAANRGFGCFERTDEQSQGHRLEAG